MKLFLTGWSGFIGKSLLASPLFAEHELICWQRPNATDKIDTDLEPNISFLKGEISASLFKNIDAVINLAGRAHKMKDKATDPLAENRAVNRDLPIALAKSAIEAGVKKFIQISTVKVMGEFQKKSGEPSMEDDEAKPSDPYGISKLEAEKALHKLFNGKDSKCIILRLPMVYGAGNKGNMLTLLKVASKGFLLPLKSVDGKRSMIFVKNVLDAIFTVVGREMKTLPSCQAYFISDGKDMTSGELYSTISKKYSGKDGIYPFPKSLLRLSGSIGTFLGLPLNRGTTRRLMDEYRFSSEKFSSAYRWKAPFDPIKGIEETVDWHKKLKINKE